MIINMKWARNSFCHLILQMWNPFSQSDQNFKSRHKKLPLFFYLIFHKKINSTEKLGKISYNQPVFLSSQTFTYLDMWFWSCGYSCLDCLFYFNSKYKFPIPSFSKKFSINLLHIVSWFRRPALAQSKEIQTFWREY